MTVRSVAVLLSSGGTPLNAEALTGLPKGRVLKTNVTRGDHATCVAVTLEHECSVGELRVALRPWAAERGWLLTVAPSLGPS